MNNLMCQIFDHRWRSGWAGARSSYFGAVVVNAKECTRCGKRDYEYTTALKPLKINLPGEDTHG